MLVAGQRTAHPALIALGAVGAVGAACAVWGIGIERYLFTVREASVKALPPGSPSIRILHVSDAHMAPWQHRKQDWLSSLFVMVEEPHHLQLRATAGRTGSSGRE